MRLNPVLKTFVVALLSIAALFGMASPACAHSDTFQSLPAQGSTVAVVTKLQFTFAEAVQKNIPAEVVLTGEMGVTFPLGTPTFDTSGVTMTVPITTGALPNGKFAAVYRVVSVDGHIATGALNFTVAGSSVTSGPVAPAASTTAASVVTSTPTQSSAEGLNGAVVAVLIVSALLALGIVTALVLVAIRRRR